MTPIKMLWLYTIAFGAASALGPDGAEMPKRAEVFSALCLSFLIAWWVVDDARKQGRPLCYDYDSFVYFLWPVLAPIYLFRTRGLKAFLVLLGFIALNLGTVLGWGLVMFIRKMNGW